MFDIFRKKQTIEMPVLKTPGVHVKIEAKPKMNHVEFPNHLVPNTSFNFPHIIKPLKIFWGSPMFHKHMNSLLINDRDKPRAGFPVNVLLELHRLLEWHDVVYPQLKPKACPWDNADLELGMR